jgi:hypothetical protein
MGIDGIPVNAQIIQIWTAPITITHEPRSRPERRFVELRRFTAGDVGRTVKWICWLRSFR